MRSESKRPPRPCRDPQDPHAYSDLLSKQLDLAVRGNANVRTILTLLEELDAYVRYLDMPI